MLTWQSNAPWGWFLHRGQTRIAAVTPAANGMLDVGLIDENGDHVSKTLCRAKSRELLVLWAGRELPEGGPL